MPSIDQNYAAMLATCDTLERKTLEFFPDTIPYTDNIDDYRNTWQAIADTQQGRYLYADAYTVQRVGFFSYCWESVKGWFGGENHCTTPRVQMTLQKYAYYGFARGYIAQDAPTAQSIEEMAQSATGYQLPVAFSQYLSQAVNSQNAAALQDSLLQYYRDNVDALQSSFWDWHDICYTRRMPASPENSGYEFGTSMVCSSIVTYIFASLMTWLHPQAPSPVESIVDEYVRQHGTAHVFDDAVREDVLSGNLLCSSPLATAFANSIYNNERSWRLSRTEGAWNRVGKICSFLGQSHLVEERQRRDLDLVSTLAPTLVEESPEFFCEYYAERGECDKFAAIVTAHIDPIKDEELQMAEHFFSIEQIVTTFDDGHAFRDALGKCFMDRALSNWDNDGDDNFAKAEQLMDRDTLARAYEQRLQSPEVVKQVVKGYLSQYGNKPALDTRLSDLLERGILKPESPLGSAFAVEILENENSWNGSWAAQSMSIFGGRERRDLDLVATLAPNLVSDNYPLFINYYLQGRDYETAYLLYEQVDDKSTIPDNDRIKLAKYYFDKGEMLYSGVKGEDDASVVVEGHHQSLQAKQIALAIAPVATARPANSEETYEQSVAIHTRLFHQKVWHTARDAHSNGQLDKLEYQTALETMLTEARQLYQRHGERHDSNLKMIFRDVLLQKAMLTYQATKQRQALTTPCEHQAAKQPVARQAIEQFEELFTLFANELPNYPKSHNLAMAKAHFVYASLCECFEIKPALALQHYRAAMKFSPNNPYYISRVYYYQRLTTDVDDNELLNEAEALFVDHFGTKVAEEVDVFNQLFDSDYPDTDEKIHSANVDIEEPAPSWSIIPGIY